MTNEADEDLAAVLRATFGGRDPVPEAVLAAARESLTWQELDARLAELTADSEEALTTVRGGGARLLTFEAPDCMVEIEAEAAGDRLRITGQLVPPLATRVRVQQPGGERRTTSDDLGRFAVEGMTPGATRVVFEAEGGPVTTVWTVL